MIDLLLLLALFVWPLGQLLVYPVSSGVNLAMLDVVAVLLTGLLIVTSKARKDVIKDSLFKPILLFDLVSLVSLLINPTLVAFAYWLRFVVYGSFYFAFRISKTDWRRWLVVASGVFIAAGFFQYLLLSDMRFLYYLGFDDHLYRLVGTLLDPNYTGLILVIISLISLVCFKGKAKLFTLIPLLALALTFSRASYLTLAVGLVFLAMRQKRFALLSIVFVLGLFVYLVPKPFGEGVNLARTFSIQSRLANQVSALQKFAEKPIAGFGFGSLKSQQGSIRQFGIPVHTGGVDNSFIFVLVTTGLIGIAVFVYLLWSIGKTVWYSDIFSVLFVVILFHSLFNNSFFYSWILAPFWTVIAYSNIYSSGKSTKHTGKDKANKHESKA